MTETMRPGGDRSARLEARVADHEAGIDRFARDQGLPTTSPAPEIDMILALSGRELRAMDREDLLVASWDLARHAIHSQDVMNRIDVRVAKYDHEIAKMTWPGAARHALYKHDDNVFMETLTIPNAAALHDLRAEAFALRVRWAKLGFLLSDLARRLDALAQEKFKRGY
jgi:hypothetical protein